MTQAAAAEAWKKGALEALDSSDKLFEFKKFAKGTTVIAKAIAASKGLKIVGGGDSASAAEKLGVAKKMTLVSTGGGASLDMIEGKEMPGLKVLCEK